MGEGLGEGAAAAGSAASAGHSVASLGQALLDREAQEEAAKEAAAQAAHDEAAKEEAPPSAPAPVQSGVGERERRQRKAPSRWAADPLSVLNLGGRLSELEQARGGGDAGSGDDAGGGGLRLPAPRARKKIIGRVIACGTPGCSRGAYHDGLCSTERAGKRTRSTTNKNGRKRSRAAPQQ